MDNEKSPRHLADRNLLKLLKHIMLWLVIPGIIMFILASLIVLMNLGIRGRNLRGSSWNIVRVSIVVQSRDEKTRIQEFA